MNGYVDISISGEMIQTARGLISSVRVQRTQASPFDTLSGILGEFAFAEWYRGSWQLHEVGHNKGAVDFAEGIEVKTSAFPFSERLNLLVRSDYALKREPFAYVQVIICLTSRTDRTILPNMIARLSGWELHETVIQAPLKDFGSKFGGRGGYQCHFIPISRLRPMSTLRDAVASDMAAERS